MLIKTSVGIQLAGKDLRFAVMRSTFGKLRLIASEVISDFAGKPSEEQKTLLRQTITRHKIPSTRVFLTLPHESGVVRQVELPVEVRETLRRAIELQLDVLSPWPAEDIYWDVIQEPVKRSGKSFIATISIIPRSTLDPWIELFKSVKLPLSGASLSSLASAHAAAGMWRDAPATIILDCEPEYVEGAFVREGRITSVTIDGTETESQMSTVVSRLRSLARVGQTESIKTVVYGPASPETSDSRAVPVENMKAGRRDEFGSIASAMLGLKRTIFESNLVPRALRHRRSQLQLMPTYVLVALTAVLAVGLLAREPYQWTKYSEKIDQEIQNLAPEVRQVSAQEIELNELSEKYRALNAHFEKRDMNLEALRELARMLPASAWLANYNYQDGAVTISGFTESAPEMQKALEDSPVFRDAQFTSSLTRDASGKDRFTLKALVGEGQQ
jgi:Tfp pilus assembly protein PilN